VTWSGAKSCRVGAAEAADLSAIRRRGPPHNRLQVSGVLVVAAAAARFTTIVTAVPRLAQGRFVSLASPEHEHEPARDGILS